MILAAGLGTRMQPFTRHTPKALIPLLGVPCIEYSIALLEDAGIHEAVVNIHSHPEQMREYLARYSQHHSFEFKVSDESNLLLGSAGGIRKAIPMLEFSSQSSTPFFSLNADVISKVDLELLAKRHLELKNRFGVVMTLSLNRGLRSYSKGAYTEISLDESTGLILGLGSKKTSAPFFTGTAVYETGAFTHLSSDRPSEFVPDVLTRWIAQGKVGFCWMDDLWLDIGSPDLWLDSHWILDNELHKNTLMPSWSRRIESNKNRYFFSKERGVIDYDDVTGASSSGMGSGIIYLKERYVS